MLNGKIVARKYIKLLVPHLEQQKASCYNRSNLGKASYTMPGSLAHFDKKGRGEKKLISTSDSAALDKVLHDLKPVTVGLLHGYVDDAFKKELIMRATPTNLQIPAIMSCVTCGIVFNDREEQKEHFKTDWHRFNLKQRLNGANHVTEMDFADLADNISSLSGSDPSDVDENDDMSETKVSCRLFDTESTEDNEMTEAENVMLASTKSVVCLKMADGQILSLYRAVLFGKKEHPVDAGDIISRIKQLPAHDTWIIAMMAGGHFAIAVFEGDKVIEHKTFHRYVVRAKCGTSQSQHDKKGSHAQSAGANLRRYNEAALAQEITTLLQSWQSYIDRCHRIFLKVPIQCYHYLFNKKEKAHFDKQDPRIRIIPFPTRRPTFKEVLRVHSELSTLSITAAPAPELADKNKPTVTVTQQMQQRDTQIVVHQKVVSERFKDQEVESSCEPVEDRDFSKGFERVKSSVKSKECSKLIAPPKLEFVRQSEFYTACLLGDDQKLQVLVTETSDECTDLSAVASLPVNKEGKTLLHIAAENTHPSLIRPLLEMGCDPSVSDGKKVVPYLSTKNTTIRDQFRLFMAEFPEKYDYEKAKIPGPLTLEEAEVKNAKKQKKAKQMNQKRKEQQKIKKAEAALTRKEEEEKARFLALSDREKRALAAERRILDSMGRDNSKVVLRCHQCAGDITGKVPFEYSNNTFCSPVCLKQHRLANR
ncbi:tRNA endonuclease ANKZF1-like isoform X3 [Watersipora subatra]|uniref:tRNA endonuclease ANKZF1-like isoform X3 n=1 Tax=Watersipora subatra TaxID=2589382 RepID=UPI00355C3EC5